MTTPPHPAKFSKPIVEKLIELVKLYNIESALDPFAGVGGVHKLPCFTVGIELEPEWAKAHPKTMVGNALALPFKDRSFDAVITSPAYGNRMADHHDARERCRQCGGIGFIEGPLLCPKCDGAGSRVYVRNTYKHQLGRPLHEQNGGGMQWGRLYRDFHRVVWQECSRVTREVILMNVSNHVRKGEEVDVVQFHREALEEAGFGRMCEFEIETKRNKFGQNRDARVESEVILVYRKLREPHGYLLASRS